MQSLRAFVIAGLLLASGGLPARALAADIYRWVDDDGRTHFGETVPEQYRAKARKLDPVAQEQKARRESGMSGAAAKPSPSSRGAPPAPPEEADDTQGGAVIVMDNLPPRGETECQAKQRAFQESVACMEPYRRRNGTLRPEALQRCPNLPMPPACR